MTVDETRHSKRADAGQHSKHILEREASALTGQLRRAVSIGQLGGFPVNAEVRRSLGATTRDHHLGRAPPARPSSCPHPVFAAPTLSAWSPGWSTASPS